MSTQKFKKFSEPKAKKTSTRSVRLKLLKTKDKKKIFIPARRKKMSPLEETAKRVRHCPVSFFTTACESPVISNNSNKRKDSNGYFRTDKYN